MVWPSNKLKDWLSDEKISHSVGSSLRLTPVDNPNIDGIENVPGFNTGLFGRTCSIIMEISDGKPKHESTAVKAVELSYLLAEPLTARCH
jgi:hypothetical protein